MTPKQALANAPPQTPAPTGIPPRPQGKIEQGPTSPAVPAQDASNNPFIQAQTEAFPAESPSTPAAPGSVRGNTERSFRAVSPEGMLRSPGDSEAALPPDAVLIDAPPAGGPSYRLQLEAEPVSATSSVAITSERSILVRPTPGSRNGTDSLQLGKLLLRIDPVYPEMAISRRIGGTVRLRASVGQYGEILSIRLLSGPPLLASAAMSAVRQWRYAPTLINGEAVETQNDLDIVFRLP